MAFNVFDESPENEIVLKEQQSMQQATKVLSIEILIFDLRAVFSIRFWRVGIYGVLDD
jgi:hypothetical protein